MSDEEDNDINVKLRALLALTVLPLRDDGSKPRKVEEILARCGVRPDEIAMVTGKNEAAVRKTLQRAGIHLRRSNSLRPK